MRLCTAKCGIRIPPILLNSLNHKNLKNYFLVESECWKRYNRYIEAIEIINKLDSLPKKEIDRFQIFLEDIFDSNYDIIFDKNIPLSSRILFPLSNGEKMGMEDARFVRFQDNNETNYLATYTAYDGKQIN